jgi:hypothetical protein
VDRHHLVPKRLLSAVPAVMLLFVVSGCTTPLTQRSRRVPEETIRKAAQQIESAVTQPSDSPVTLSDYPELTVDIPAIRDAISARRTRYVLVEEFKDEGYIGENSRALIHDRIQQVPMLGGSCMLPGVARRSSPHSDVDGKLHNRITLTILAENGDRWDIYETLNRENKLPRSALDIIQETFRSVHEETARPGHLVQSAEGEWIKKQ